MNKKPETQLRKHTAVVDQAEVLRKVHAIENEVSVLSSQADLVEIEDVDDYAAICNRLIDVVERRNYIDEQRDGFMAEARALISRVEGWFAQAYTDIEKAEATFRDAVKAYALARHTTAVSMRERAAALPESKEAQAKKLFKEADALDLPKVPGIAVTTKSVVKILDESKLAPRFFKKVPDLKLIEAELSAGKKVTGAELATDKGVRVTPSHRKDGSEA